MRPVSVAVRPAGSEAGCQVRALSAERRMVARSPTAMRLVAVGWAPARRSIRGAISAARVLTTSAAKKTARKKPDGKIGLHPVRERGGMKRWCKTGGANGPTGGPARP